MSPLVVIGIPTYKRPQALRKLLGTIAAQQQLNSLVPHVLIADNEGPQGQGITTALTMQHEGFPFPITSIPVTQRGISFTRNALLTAGFQTLNADFLVMLDDDIWLSPNWLSHMLSMQQQTQADVISGRLIPQFPPHAPKWALNLGIYQNSWDLQPGIVKTVNGTPNILIHQRLFSGANLPLFSPEFALTGGEDVDFFKTLQSKQAIFAYANQAECYELFEHERLTRAWVLRRAFRMGTGITQMFYRHQPTLRHGLTLAAQSIFWAAVGCALMPALAFSHKYQMKCANLIAFNLGQLAGFLKVKVYEYANR